jgi:ABC-type dipeptide/oligopeptide/nickel transport system ATPase component
VPRLDKKWDEVEVELTEKKGSPVNGCVFYDRCRFDGRNDDCCKQPPPLVEVETNHFVACCCCEDC